MKKQRRLFLKTFPTIFTSGLVSCASWEENNKNWLESSTRYRFYEEDISSFMVTKDGSKLVVITSSYHYIFRLPKKLAAAINSDIRPKLTLGFTALSSDYFDRLSGTMTLFFVPRTSEDRRLARKIGFYRLGSRPRLESSFRLEGKRFRASDIQLTEKQQLNHSYRIKIREPNPKFKDSVKYSSHTQISPIEQAANGVLLLVGLPLLIFTLSAHCMSNDGECLR